MKRRRDVIGALCQVAVAVIPTGVSGVRFDQVAPREGR
jgi:hypothetical protein